VKTEIKFNESDQVTRNNNNKNINQILFSQQKINNTFRDIKNRTRNLHIQSPVNNELEKKSGRPPKINIKPKHIYTQIYPRIV